MSQKMFLTTENEIALFFTQMKFKFLVLFEVPIIFLVFKSFARNSIVC